jgi:hypothetical protein
MSKKKHSIKPWDASAESNSLPWPDTTVTSTNIPQSTTSIPYPITTAPYYTTTTTSPTYHPNWMEKDFHEYIAYKDRFKKFLEMREEFNKYLDNKLAFEEYMAEGETKEPIPTIIDF